jgi:hypothetical protein
MVSNLIRLFDTGTLKIAARSKEIDAMVLEHVSDTGHDNFGAFETGSHDDLVCALGLATWLGEQYGAPQVMFW